MLSLRSRLTQWLCWSSASACCWPQMRVSLADAAAQPACLPGGPALPALTKSGPVACRCTTHTHSNYLLVVHAAILASSRAAPKHTQTMKLLVCHTVSVYHTLNKPTCSWCMLLDEALTLPSLKSAGNSRQLSASPTSPPACARSRNIKLVNSSLHASCWLRLVVSAGARVLLRPCK